MENLEKIKNQFTNVYLPMIKQFMLDIENLNLSGIPEPCLPSFGKSYPFTKYKIAFIGRDAKGYGIMKDFIEHFNKCSIDSLFRNEVDFDDFEFLNYTNNFGKSFWDYILQFLAVFYEINDWKKLKNNEIPQILSSFVWGNTNIISPYDQIPNNQNIILDDYNKVKAFSKKMDNVHYLIESLSPDIIVILNWNLDENYFKLTSDDKINFEDIDEHLKYCQIDSTHIFWHAHPTWINMEIGYEKSLSNLNLFIKQKLKIKKKESLNIDSLLNNNYLDLRKENIVSLAEYLSERNHKMSGWELVQYCNRNNIKTTYDTDYVYGRGIYSFIKSTYNYCKYILKDDVKAEKVAASFVKDNGEYAFD